MTLVEFEGEQAIAFQEVMQRAEIAELQVLALSADLAAARADVKTLRAWIEDTAYAQGTDKDGWYRTCTLCGEDSRLPERNSLVHSVTCVLASAAAEGEG